MTKPRQFAPTMGLAHGGVEFSKGTLSGLESYAVGIMTKSRRGRYYIDYSLWEPQADSIKSGYRVPFGRINVFICMIGTPVPEPNTSTDIVEPARYVLPITRRAGSCHAFVSFTQGNDVQDEPAVQEITPVNSDGESSMGRVPIGLYKLSRGEEQLEGAKISRRLISGWAIALLFQKGISGRLSWKKPIIPFSRYIHEVPKCIRI